MKKTFLAVTVASTVLTPMLTSAEADKRKVIGTVTPPACVPSVAGGSSRDYGTISAGQPNVANHGTTLTEKTTSLSVACDTPTLLALKITNVRGGTASTHLPDLPVAPWAAKFGLGKINNADVGAHSIKFARPAPDSDATSPTMSPDRGAHWYHLDSPALLHDGNRSGFSDSRETTPFAQTDPRCELIGLPGTLPRRRPTNGPGAPAHPRLPCPQHHYYPPLH